MKLAFITTSFPKFQNDSHAPWILSIAKSLVNDGHDVTVHTPASWDLNKKDTFDGVNVVRFRYMTKSWERVAYGANIPANVANSYKALIAFPFFMLGFLIAAIRSLSNIDIVHAQFGYSGVFAAFAGMLRCSKAPLFVSFYGRDVSHVTKFPLFYKFLFYRATKILVLSKDMADRMENQGCDSSKLIVHHLGVDCSVFKPDKIKKQNDITRFLLVANFVEKKGIEIAIEATSILIKKNCNIELVLVGRGPLEKKLKTKVYDEGLSKNVFFVNNYETTDPRLTVLDAMKAADVFLLPSVSSKNDYGGTPIVLMESGAVGLPAITTENAGNSEIVLNGVTGEVVKEGDVGAIVSAMQYFIENPKYCQDMGKNARNHILRHFNLNKQVEDLQAIYENNMTNHI